MKNWKIIIASVMAFLLLIVTPLSVIAANAQSTPPANTPQTPAVHLAIVQPWAVRVGQQMQLTVFERLNQTPIDGAGVWTVAKDSENTVRQAIKELVLKGATATEADYAAVLNARGTQLGITDASGRITHNFTEPDSYWLVAIKTGYLPGFSSIAVREPLAINVQNKATPGEAVTITVDQKGTADPVSGADVWAIDFSSAKVLRDKLEAARAANKGNLNNVDWDSALKNIATHLGVTNDSGQVTHTFDKGRYVLIATEKGCVPAYSRLVVATPPTTAPTVTPQSNADLH